MVDLGCKTLFFILCFILFSYGMISISVSRYQSYLGTKSFNRGKLDPAVFHFNNALSLIPFGQWEHLFGPDLARNKMMLGKTVYRLAIKEADSDKRLNLLEKSRQYLLEAHIISPLDIKPVKGLALSLKALEFESRNHFPEKHNPYNALPMYEKMAQIRPNGLTVHYMIARYFFKKEMHDDLKKTVEHIAFLKPGDFLNGDLTSEPFYDETLNASLVKGLEHSIARDVHPRDAYMALSKLLEQRDEYQPALENYKKAVRIRESANKSYHYQRLGRLYLKNRLFPEAFASFNKSLDISLNLTKDIHTIFRIFKKENQIDEFIKYAGSVKDQYKNLQPFGMVIARARIKQGFDNLAKAGLLKMLAEQPGPEVFYLLSNIAEKEGNWDEMELYIQRASVLDPDNCQYYLKFAKALYKQGKVYQAKEKEALKIKCLQNG